MTGIILAALAVFSSQDRHVPDVEAAALRSGANCRPPALVVDKAAWEWRPTGQGYQPAPRRLYRWSVVALVAAASLDVASSAGKYELNPVLGRGVFGRRQVGIKIGLTAGAIGAQQFLLRRFKGPKSRRALTVLNSLQAGALGAVAVRNWRTR